MQRQEVQVSEESHRELKIWLTIVVFAVIISAVALFGGTGATGFVAFDTGAEASFNPDFIGESEFYSHAKSAGIAVGAVVVVQVLVYMIVTRFYSSLEK